MSDRLHSVDDPLKLGFGLLAALRRFHAGLRLILYGFVLQAVSQVLMLSMFICIAADAAEGISPFLYHSAINIQLVGIVLGFVGRRSCLRHSPAIGGRWLLVAAIVADVVAFLALLSPVFTPIWDVRRFSFVPESAGIALYLLFVWRLMLVIEFRGFGAHIAATLGAGLICLATFLAVYWSIPAVRTAGPTLPLIVGNFLAILWCLAACIFASLYSSLLVRLMRALGEFDSALLTHTTERYLTGTQ